MPHTTLISTESLAPHVGDSTWVIADCRHNLKDEAWGRHDYLAGHIRGAVFVSLEHDLSGPKGAAGRHPLPSPEIVAATFGRLGIGPDTPVVAYDQDAGQYASRLWWMLRYMGHDAVAVLDGGWTKWLQEQRPIRDGQESRPATTFPIRVREDMQVGIAEVETRLSDPRTLLVDARSPQRFMGQPDPLDNVPGHIPGARNRFFRDNIAEGGTMKPVETLRADFTALLGNRPVDASVMYCGSGVTACHNLLAMEHVGLRGAKLYVGSWSEWEADPARPRETGPAQDVQASSSRPVS